MLELDNNNNTTRPQRKKTVVHSTDGGQFSGPASTKMMIRSHAMEPPNLCVFLLYVCVDHERHARMLARVIGRNIWDTPPSHPLVMCIMLCRHVQHDSDRGQQLFINHTAEGEVRFEKCSIRTNCIM